MASGDKFYIADKDTLDEVNSKIGTTTDIGGSETTGTIFAKLNKIIHDILGMVTSIGKTTDTGATETTGTVMGKLNKISHDINTGEITNGQIKLAPSIFRNNGKLVRVGISRSFQNLRIDKIEGNYIFAYGGINRSGKLKFDKNTLDIVADGDDAYYGDYVPSYVDDVDYTYAFSVGSFYKYSRVDGRLVGTAAYVSNCSGTSYASMDNEFVYVSTNVNSSPKVLKYNKNTLTLVNTYPVDIQGAIFVEPQNIYILSETDNTILNAYNKTLAKIGTLTADFESNSGAKKVLHVYEHNGYTVVAYLPYYTNEFLAARFNINTFECISHYNCYPGAGKPNDTNNLRRTYVSSPVGCHGSKIAIIDLYSMKVFIMDLETVAFENHGDVVASASVIDDSQYTFRTAGSSVVQTFTARNVLFDGENVYCVVTLMMPYYGDTPTNLTLIDNRIIHFKLLNGAVYKTNEYCEVV